jgi:uncharacterized membrane protein YqjE
VNDNGQSTKKKNVVGEVIGLVEDHLDLATLEWEYEKQQGARKLTAIAVAGVLILTAYVLVQFGLVHTLTRLGLSSDVACALLASVYVLLGGLILWQFARRDPRAGRPFQATCQEITKNLQWIQKLFS